MRLEATAVIAGAARFPWVWLGVAIVAATLWTGLALTQNNLEVQSIDLCHHAMFVGHLVTPLGTADPQFVGFYPLLSHRVATLWMPLFHNPIQAVRAAALTSLFAILVAQWYLLRTRLSPALAMLALVAWQCLCTTCKLGNVNHFLWEFQYNYSRAVSAAALWIMLLTFVMPPSRYRIFNLFIAIGLAAFAFACHIAAGSLALAACGVWCLVNVIRRDWLMGLGGLLGLGLAAGSLLQFTDEWRYLASLSPDNGPLPIRHADLIALWIPTSIIGLIIALWKARYGRALTIDLSTAVLCGLLPAAVLQGYMLFGKNVAPVISELYGIIAMQTIGTYPYNQMLFYTFSLTVLFWAAALVELGQRWSREISPRVNHAVSVCAMAAAAWGLYAMLEADPRRSRVEPERDPINVINELRPLHDHFLGHYYYDPNLEHASYFVTRSVLTRDSNDAARYRLHCHVRKPKDLFREPGLKGLFLPATAEIDAILGPACPRVRIGNFWQCDLDAYRTTPEFARFLAGG